MRVSGVILPALVALCVSFTSAPAANAMTIGNPAASAAVNSPVKPVYYYRHRHYRNCYRPYARHYRRHYRHRSNYCCGDRYYRDYSNYDQSYRHHRRRYWRDDDYYD